jgi:hypothetical protein
LIGLGLALDNHYDIESPDFKFGFNVLMFANCVIYAPIFTASAGILYYKNVNKAVLSNKWCSLLYCILPFLCYELGRRIFYVVYNYSGIWIDEDYITPVVFIIQNLILVVIKYIKREQRG